MVAAVSLAVGCGSSADAGDGGVTGAGGGAGGAPAHPDTGAGKNETVPSTRNCHDLCARFGACLVVLCNEDSSSTRFTDLGEFLAGQCEATCTDSLAQSALTPTQWSCLFMSSCRQVFEHDVCDAESSYYCTF